MTGSIFLAAYPLLLYGILQLPRCPLSPAQRVRGALDGLIVLASASIFGW